MTILVVGASGSTGRHLVEQLLIQGHKLKAIVRSPEKLPESWKSNDHLKIITASVLELSHIEMCDLVLDCHAIVSCLGHNLNLKGIYGQPRKLVRDTATKLCDAIKENRPKSPVKYILMSTAGYRNGDLKERISFGQKFIIGLIRLLLPPHVDNEKAADFLRSQIGQNNSFVEWVAVRPDNLTDEEKVTNYEIHDSPIRSAIFKPGKTSRINVGHFMAALINDSDLWNSWKGQMPVIYNKLSLN